MNKDGGSYVCVYLQSFTILSLCTVLLISQAHININRYIPLTFHISVIKSKNAIFENLLIIVIIICFLIACQFEIYRWQSTSADISAMAERNFNCGGGGGEGRR